MHAATRHDRAPQNLLDMLSPDERRQLEPFLKEVQLAQRELLCTAGRTIAGVVFPETAVTSTLMEMPEGDWVEVGLTGTDGMVGLDLLYGIRESVTTVIAQVPGRALKMDAEVFHREIVAKKTAFYDVLPPAPDKVLKAPGSLRLTERSRKRERDRRGAAKNAKPRPGWNGGVSSCAERQNRTADTGFFRPVLYQLSYLGAAVPDSSGPRPALLRNGRRRRAAACRRRRAAAGTTGSPAPRRSRVRASG